MRGKASSPINSGKNIRITPAYAGKRQTGKAVCQRTQDHPRLCGEKNTAVAVTLLHFGITPAYAGKSIVRDKGQLFDRDHPRLCGEKIMTPALCWEERGSPPPMRGKGTAHRT